MGDDRARGQPDARRARWLDMLHDVASIANEAESLDDALSAILERVCRHNGWYLGLASVPARSRESWWREPGDEPVSEAFEAASRFARAWSRQVMETRATRLIIDFTVGEEAEPTPSARAPEAGGGVATPLGVGGTALGALTFLSETPLDESLDPEDISALRTVIESVATHIGHLVERQNLLRRIAEETEAERASLGRQVHDGLSQQLVGIKLLAQNLRRRLRETPTADASDHWELLLESLGEAQRQARALAHSLDIDVLESASEDSLVVQLEDLTGIVEAGHQVACDLTTAGRVTVGSAFVRSQLLRIAREAVFNALRHAEPRRISIRLDGDTTRLLLSVRDDGSGMEEGSVGASGGMGIASMRYRAGLVGAALRLESAPGRGTLVECVLRQP